MRVDAEQTGPAWRVPLPSDYGAGRAAFVGEVELSTSSGTAFTIHTPVQVWELGPSRP